MENKSPLMPENKMGTQPVGRLLMGMAIPMMLSMLVQAFYNVVDSYFVSQITNENNYALTAVSLAFPLQNLMIAFGGGTAVGINAILSRALGEKRQDMVDRSANTGIFLSLLCGIIFALVGAFLTKPFFNFVTDEADVIKYGVDYASICLIFSVGIFCQFCFERLLQSTGKTKLSMLTQLTGAVINIILDPIFIFDKGDALFGGAFVMPFGFGMEVAGAAVATVTGQVIAAIFALILNITVNHEIHISLRKIRWDTDVVRRIYSIGFPSILMQSVGSVMNFGLNQILLSLDMVAVDVFGVYFKLQSFVFMPIFGLNSGMVPIIAYNYGAKNFARIKKTIILSLIVALSIMAVGAAVFEIAPRTLLSFFNADAAMLDMGEIAFRIIAINFILAAFCIISISVFQAIGNPMHSTIVSICRQLGVLLPAAWLIAKLTRNINLVWWSFPLAELVSVALCAIFLISTLKNVKKQTEETNE